MYDTSSNYYRYCLLCLILTTDNIYNDISLNITIIHLYVIDFNHFNYKYKAYGLTMINLMSSNNELWKKKNTFLKLYF